MFHLEFFQNIENVSISISVQLRNASISIRFQEFKNVSIYFRKFENFYFVSLKIISIKNLLRSKLIRPTKLFQFIFICSTTNLTHLRNYKIYYFIYIFSPHQNSSRTRPLLKDKRRRAHRRNARQPDRRLQPVPARPSLQLHQIEIRSVQQGRPDHLLTSAFEPIAARWQRRRKHKLIMLDRLQFYDKYNESLCATLDE